MRTMIGFLFFFNDTATTEIYTLSLHDALPIYAVAREVGVEARARTEVRRDGRRLLDDEPVDPRPTRLNVRSEEHTSELQSRLHLVCRLLLEKKKSKPPNLSSSRSPTTTYSSPV